MDNLHRLLEWWNLLFTLPLLVGLLFSLVGAVGFMLSGHAGGVEKHGVDADVDQGDVGHDLDADVDQGDVGHDLDADVDQGDIGHDVDAADVDQGDIDHEVGVETEQVPAEVAHGEVAHEAHAEHAHGHESLLTQLLEAFGIGRGVPISVMLPFCMMLWGVLGLASNQALHPVLRFPAVYVWVSVLVSLLGTSLIARGISGMVARYLQLGQVPSVSRERLVGGSGIAVYTINKHSGVADVRDAGGTVHRIPCRTGQGDAVIPAGTPIVVTDYEAETGAYLVEENPFTNIFSDEEVRT